MRLNRKVVVWIAAGGVVVAFLALTLRPEAVKVEWAIAERGTMRVLTEAEAETRSRAKYVITAPVTGRVERLRLDAGDPVRVGMVIARIAPLPLDRIAADQAQSRLSAAQATAREFEARVNQARLGAGQAKRDVARARAVEAAGGLSLQARENTELVADARADELRALEARLRAAEAEARVAAAALLANRTGAPAVEVRSPMHGQVLRVPEMSERVTTAGSPLLELGDAADIEVVADLLSADAARIPPGAAVELEGWGGVDSIRHARVRLVEPAAFTRVSALGVDEQRVNVIIEAPRDAPILGDGYRLTARIVLWAGENVLMVPASAVFRSGDDWTVFVVEEGRARSRAIRVGHRSDAAVEVLSGVAIGDTVVLFPSDRVRSGARLEMR
jgi:HlyD family secretion protein